jgi:hypothetical protein
MSRSAALLLAGLLLIGAATVACCTALDPFPTAALVAQPGASAGPRVAICYNTLSTSLAEVQAEAQQECGANTVASPIDTDWYLQNCPLLLPARATFVCTAKE